MAEQKMVSREGLVRSLRSIAMADKTAYEHHERRARDRRQPETDGGTIWLTPREVALSLLSFMGEDTTDLYWPFTAPDAPAKEDRHG